MSLELKLIKSFQAVADRLSFRRAAETLHLTQPALTKQIQLLEKSIGAPLFDRDRRSVTLTHAGKFLHERAAGLLAAADALARETREAADGQRGTLSLGYTESAMAGFLPSLLRDLREKLPAVSVRLQQEHSGRLAREVARGKLDAAIISLGGNAPGLTRTPMATDALGIVLPDSHPLTVRQQIPLAALAGERFIMFPWQENPDLHGVIVSACQAAGFTPEIIEEAATRLLAVNMVAAGFGVTFLSENLAHYCGPGTVFKPLKPPKPLMQYYLVEPADGENPCVAELKKILRASAHN